ncbi:MAG: metallophosphoesterase [Myxococcota bacterium]
MKSISFVARWCVGPAVIACACSHSSQSQRDGELGDGAGRVQLALSSVPNDAGCLRVTAEGSRSLTRLFSLEAGTSPKLVLDRLPLGIVRIDAQAFATGCSAVGNATAASWVSESVVPVRVDAREVAQVVLKLIRNGRANVTVDFEPPAWIAATRAPVDLAIVGDAPYGAGQIADFPKLIADIAAASGVSEVVHLGDIKNGSSRCDDSYFQFVLDNLQASALPLVYTPGDNEWTDCHRANNGAYDPLERLATLRSLFYPVPGLSLGASKRQVLSQSFFAGSEAFVENQLWLEAGSVFATLHVVGSNNSLLPWYADDTTGTKVDDPERRVEEAEARTTANLAWLDRTFATANEQNAAGVVLMMQADMWDGANLGGFDSTIQKIAALTLTFGKPVLLLEGDSHVFKQDNPLANGDLTHGVATPVPNLTRVVVQGSTTTPLPEWLRLHVDPAAPQPFSWTRNPR